MPPACQLSSDGTLEGVRTKCGKSERLIMRALLALVILGLLSATTLLAQSRKTEDRSWISDFQIDKNDLTSTGRNPYFILEPGYSLHLEQGTERLAITVLDETRMVDGVETRIVEERETKNGQLVEISRNFFAISRRTQAVYYFGEEVDIYKAGKIVSHEGAWQAGINGARFGLMMPGEPVRGFKFYQEVAPGVAMDRAEIVSLNEALKTPAGDFKDVLKIVETTPLERGVKEAKYYASGVGLLQDGNLRLVKYGKN